MASAAVAAPVASASQSLPQPQARPSGPCWRCPQPGSLRCTKCQTACYCSRQCQMKDWELEHKTRCKDIRRQQAAQLEAAPAATAADVPGPSPSPPLEGDLTEESVTLRRPSRWLSPPSSLPALFAAGVSCVPARPVGLRNPKRLNSCFLNVVLQMLTYSAPLAAWMENSGHSAEECAIKASGEHCTLCAIARHRRLVLEQSGDISAAAPSALPQPLLPKEILQHLSSLNSDYVLGQQEDSQETMKSILHVMDEQWRKDQRAKEGKAAAAASDAAASDASDSAPSAPLPPPSVALSQRTLETTPLCQLFGGYLLSQLRCASPGCGRTTSSFEHFLDLSLELIEATDDLSEMLEAFSRVERLDAKNTWRCGHCQKATRAHKQITIFQQPNLLMIQLKRFRGGMFGKVNKYIHFPLQLSLRKYMAACVRTAEEAARAADENTESGSALDTPYVLYGVVVHLDIMNVAAFGHYISFVRKPEAMARAVEDARAAHKAAIASSSAPASTPATAATALASIPEGDRSWLKFDDDEVTQVSAREVLKQRAYILFYQRVEPYVSEEEVEEEKSADSTATVATNGTDAASPSPAAPAASAPVQCVGNCGFWGNAAQLNMCSQCYRKYREDRGEIPKAAAAPPPSRSAAQSSGGGGGMDPQQLMMMMVMRQRMQQQQRQAQAQAARAQAEASSREGARGEEEEEEVARMRMLQARMSQLATDPSYAAEVVKAAPAPAPAAAPASAPAPASSPSVVESAPAPAGTPVAVASDPVKQCSACHDFLPASSYTGAQLKKQGKRTCKGCVEKHTKLQAQAKA